MSKTELIEKTLESLNKLPEYELKAIHDFAAFLLSKINQRLLTEEVTQFNINSSSYKFLADDKDLYTVNDLKVKYGK